MNLGLEYLIRTGVIKQFIKLPCSLFLADLDEKKIVVTLHSVNCDGIIGHYWDFFGCSNKSALPPMYEFQASNLHQVRQKLNGHKILAYKETSVPNNYNSWRYPMPDYIYKNYSDDLMYSSKHKRKKELWLWREFLNIYGLKFKASDNYEHLSEYSIIQNQMHHLKKSRSKYWCFWSLWKKNFLLHDDGELFFLQSPC